MNVNIAAIIEAKKVIFLVFLKPLSNFPPLSLAKIGKTAKEENAMIAEADAIKLKAD